MKSVKRRSKSKPKINPIQRDPIPVVIQNAFLLDQICKYISLQDMFSCRNVNNLWKSQWTPAIQQRSNLELCITNKMAMLVKELQIGLKERPTSDWETRAREYFRRMDKNEAGTRAKLLVRWIFQNIHNFPCSRIRVGLQITNLMDDENLLINFFRSIANFATELALEFDSKGRPFPFQSLDGLQLESCKLKAFELQYRYSTETHQDITLRFFRNLVQKAEKLDKLSLVYRRSQEDDFFVNCIAAIQKPQELTSLHLNGTLKDRELQMLVDKRLVLKELGLYFNTDFCFHKTFRIFLKSQINSLKELYLMCKCELQFTQTDIPEMTILERLELEVYTGTFMGLRIQQSFPNLKKLKLLGNAARVGAFFDPGFNPIQTLEELDMRSVSLTKNAIFQACRMFPNLKKLSIVCYKSYMSVLKAESFLYLEEITLCCGDSEHMRDQMNEALTGFSKNKLVAMEKSGICAEYMLRQPFAFLQNVKTLRLENGVLTNWVCSLGPMKLRYLRCLDLRQSHSTIKHKISETMLASMRERFTVLL